MPSPCCCFCVLVSWFFSYLSVGKYFLLLDSETCSPFSSFAFLLVFSPPPPSPVDVSDCRVKLWNYVPGLTPCLPRRVLAIKGRATSLPWLPVLCSPTLHPSGTSLTSRLLPPAVSVKTELRQSKSFKSVLQLFCFLCLSFSLCSTSVHLAVLHLQMLHRFI